MRLMPLSSAWHRAIDELVRMGGEEIASKDVWVVDFDLGVVEASEVLAVLPGTFDRRGEHWEEMVDATGAGVDYEYEAAVYACDAERAVFRYTEHWQAGLVGQLAVYANDAAYRAALAVALAALDALDE